MRRVSATISEDLEQLLSGAVEAGIYSGKSDAVRDSIRSFIRDHPELAEEIAVELYLEDEMGLLSASRLAQMSVPEFRAVLDYREEV